MKDHISGETTHVHDWRQCGLPFSPFCPLIQHSPNRNSNRFWVEFDNQILTFIRLQRAKRSQNIFKVGGLACQCQDFLASYIRWSEISMGQTSTHTYGPDIGSGQLGNLCDRKHSSISCAGPLATTWGESANWTSISYPHKNQFSELKTKIIEENIILMTS